MNFNQKINLIGRFYITVSISDSTSKLFWQKSTLGLQEEAIVIEPAFTDGSCFAIGIPKGSERWSIIHIPSETSILSSITSREDAEDIIDIFKLYIDYDSVILMTPKFEQISDDIDKAMRMAILDFKDLQDSRVRL